MKHILLLTMLVAACCTVGCTMEDSSKPTTRQSRDPYTYTPRPSDEEMNISGGAINNYDDKGMRRDLDHVLNP